MSFVLALAGACATDQSDDSVGTAQQAAEATGLLLNEVLFNPYGQGTAIEAYQYIEIAGSANGTLDGYYVVVVDGRAAGGGSNPGRVLGVANLGTACAGAACAIGSNGLLVVTPSATGGFTFPSATTRVSLGYTMDNNSGAGTDDYSILLVKSTVAITTATDFDATNNGTFALAGVTIVDAIGWRESTTGFVYGTVNVKPNTAAQTAPAAIVRIASNTTALTVNGWFYGGVTGTVGSATELTDPTASGTGAIPAGLTDITPGLANIAANIPNNGTAGAAGTAGTSGVPAVAGAAGRTNGTAGTAGIATSVVGEAGQAGNAGTAGSAGLPIIPPPTGGAPPSTGGAPAVTGGAPAIAGAANNVAGQGNDAGAAGTSVVVVPTAGSVGVAGATSTSAAGSNNATGGKATGGATTAVNTGGAVTTTGGAAVATGGKSTVAGGATSTTATTAKGGAPAAGGSSATTTESSDDSGEDEGSCGCRTVGSSKAPTSGMAALLGLIGIVLSRRRRRR